MSNTIDGVLARYVGVNQKGLDAGLCHMSVDASLCGQKLEPFGSLTLDWSQFTCLNHCMPGRNSNCTVQHVTACHAYVCVEGMDRLWLLALEVTNYNSTFEVL